MASSEAGTGPEGVGAYCFALVAGIGCFGQAGSAVVTAFPLVSLSSPASTVGFAGSGMASVVVD